MTPGTTREVGAYERGQQARRRGQEKTVNPHKRDKVSQKWWVIGWEEVDRELSAAG
ncbi:hypothetical protein GOD54_23585 [Sinorhizobium medicae]|nr:hypothetical protein [Sinorhizobium medicae]